MTARSYTFRQLQISLGIVCRKSREEMGLTIPGFAEAFGIHKSTVSQIENGKGNPCLHTLQKLIKAFGPEVIDTAEWLAAVRTKHGRPV